MRTATSSPERSRAQAIILGWMATRFMESTLSPARAVEPGRQLELASPPLIIEKAAKDTLVKRRGREKESGAANGSNLVKLLFHR